MIEGKVAIITGAGSGMGEAEDIAYSALYLASDDAKFINGVV